MWISDNIMFVFLALWCLLVLLVLCHSISNTNYLHIKQIADNLKGGCCFLLQVASARQVYENMTRWHVENVRGVIMFFCATWIQNETSELTCWCCGIEKYLTCLEMWCGPQGKSTCWQIVWIICFLLLYFYAFEFLYICAFVNLYFGTFSFFCIFVGKPTCWQIAWSISWQANTAMVLLSSIEGRQSRQLYSQVPQPICIFCTWHSFFASGVIIFYIWVFLHSLTIPINRLVNLEKSLGSPWNLNLNILNAHLKAYTYMWTCAKRRTWKVKVKWKCGGREKAKVKSADWREARKKWN